MPEDILKARVVSSGVRNSGGEAVRTMDTKRKAEMTVEERANYERERNRVHARNTRARKKQYMEELKERVENMHTQRATVEREKAEAARQEEEQIQNWRKMLGKVMDLRSDGVVDEAQWNQGMCEYIAKKCKEKTGGGGEKDTAVGQEAKVHFQCFLGTGDFLFASPEGIMCMFNMRTVDAREYGAPTEVEKSGMLRACFDESGKVQELDMMFDGIAVHQQISRVTGSDPAKFHAQAAMRDQEGGQNASIPSQDANAGENITLPASPLAEGKPGTSTYSSS